MALIFVSFRGRTGGALGAIATHIDAVVWSGETGDLQLVQRYLERPSGALESQKQELALQ